VTAPRPATDARGALEDDGHDDGGSGAHPRPFSVFNYSAMVRRATDDRPNGPVTTVVADGSCGDGGGVRTS